MAQKYIVSGTLSHGVLEDDKDGNKVSVVHVYHDGDEFETDDPTLEKELRAVKTLLLPEEYAAAAASEGNTAPQEALAAQRQALEDENAALRAELEALKASKAAKGGDSK